METLVSLQKWIKGHFAGNLKVTTFPTPQKSVERCLLECKKRAKLVPGKGLREHLPPDPTLVKVLRSLVSFGNENRNLAAISFPTDGDLLYVEISTEAKMDILEYIRDNKVDVNQIIAWTCDIGETMDFLLEKRVLLWDIRPECIFMEKQEWVKFEWSSGAH
ncbi:uncharacterized protein LOC106155964 [Lingula anatina]|uniref:Uncharacterized protein LOC106155964 n=1 Tax=Lingula anatina TaxID=7574 RepID=A0A1S3HKB7_LINAN|nr:uncharacterized protein LOC106155964 [Lingula anatina]|eukprot:XP_013386467.1 uncharacterized protein LOC106155964 [Lingula anatina]